MEKIDKKTDGKKKVMVLVIILLYSLALPFVLGFIHAGITGQQLQDTFADFYRFFVLAGIVFAMLLTIELYIFSRRKDLIQNNKQLGVILVSVAITYIAAVIFGYYISVFAMPLVLSGLIIALLVDKRLALFSNIVVCITFFLCYITLEKNVTLSSVVASILTQGLSSSVLIILMRKFYTRASYLCNAVLVGILCAAPVAFLAGLLDKSAGISDALLSAVWAFISVLLGLALFMIILPVCETLFGSYSNFRLEEICSPENKLLKQLEKEAPGTYNHSLAVGNLAEVCAMKIGENPALAKAAACYHDVGKLKNPLCFTENQTGYNPHDDFIPEVSVYTITEHTTYGEELIRKNRLPDIIADIAKEHHGTTPVQYFLNKAKGITDEQLQNEQFCYPGPKPQSKIAGLIMIVDTVEAASRSQGVDSDKQNFRFFVHKLISGKMDSGQFSECPLTFKDMQDIEDTLVETLPSLYHQRIKYNNNK